MTGDGIRALVYETFAAEGRAPSVAELAQRTSRTPAAVLSQLRSLAGHHALVLNGYGDAIRMAHPFSAAPMAFVVTPLDGRDDRRWWGGCAWDSFGISAALDLDVRIDTACPGCGEHLALECGPRTPPLPPSVVRFPRPAADWWPDVVETCSDIRLFCNPSHADDWVEHSGRPQGELVAGVTVWQLAGPWYGDRLDADFSPHSREHNQELLDSHGLRGDFWKLP